MKRRELLRNALLGMAVCLLPKILRPEVAEVIEEGSIWNKMIAASDEYILTTLKMRSVASGTTLPYWEVQEWKELEKERSGIVNKIHQLIESK